MAKKITGRNYEEVHDFIADYLGNYYIDNSDEISKGTEFIKKSFIDNFETACDKLIKITGQPLYRNDFKVYLTTFPRAPYNYERGELWLPVKWINPIANFMHEVLHFQTIHYWRNNEHSGMSRLNEADFNTLKEALTVVLDERLVPPMEKADAGYESHKKIRADLHDFWIKSWDYNELIEFGCKQFDAR